MSYVETESVRDASRRMVRELGFLHDHHVEPGLSTAQCHTLLELRRHGRLTAVELAELLRVDKSAITRTAATLAERGWVEVRDDPADRRRKPLALTAAGLARAEEVDAWARRQVEEALDVLTPPERARALDGLTLYARALERARRQREHLLRPVAPRDDAELAALIRAVMTEHGASGPGFAIHDPEVNHMSRAYSEPGARYLVIEHRGRVVGGGGFAPLAGGEAGVCELRKMYFYPEVRGLGLGARLLGRLLREAEEAGYHTCYLETLGSMAKARRLYEAFGFTRLEGPRGATGHHGCDAWYTRALDR
jgi:putative acetyltransferase